MRDLYEHTGKAPVLGTLLATVCGLLTAIVLSFVYVYLCIYVPFIFLNVVFTLGFGLLIGGAVTVVAYTGKIRHTFLVTLLGVLCATVGLYFAWAIDATVRLVDNPGLAAALHPQELIEYLKFGYAEGLWSFSGHPVKGVLVALFWIAEAAILLGVAGFVPHMMIDNLRFCERCSQWMDDREDVLRISDPSAAVLAARFREGDFAILNDVTLGCRSDGSFSRVDLAKCSSCDQSHYVAVYSVVRALDDDGKETHNATVQLPYSSITAEEREIIRATRKRSRESKDDQNN